MPAPLIQDDVKPAVKELYLDLLHFFPDLTHFYGYAGTPDHNSRRCLDAMVYDSSGKYAGKNLPYAQRIALGNRVMAFLKKNAAHYGINGFIWNRHVYGFPHTGGTGNYKGPYGAARTYTQTAHDDHLHIDIDGRTFKPLRPPKYLEPYYVDPAKVSTFLLGNKGNETPKQRPPGYAITTGVEIVTGSDGRKWLVTDAGWAYNLAYLTKTKPGKAEPPVVVPPKESDPQPEPKPEPAPVLRVAFWNTRRSSYAADKSTPRDWERRDDLAHAFLKSIPGGLPDALGTCETTHEQTVDLARYTGMYGIGNGLGGHPKDVSSDNNSVFLSGKLEKLRVVNVNTGSTSDPMSRRYMLCVEVRVKSTGEILWLGATHLNRSNTAKAKEKEISVLLSEAKTAGVDLNRFILGMDANDPVAVGSPGVRRAARDGYGLDDIRNRLSDKQFRGDSWDTFTGWTPTVEKTGRHIDIIFVGANIQVSEGEIVPVKNGASDHHLLLCSISLTQPVRRTGAFRPDLEGETY